MQMTTVDIVWQNALMIQKPTGKSMPMGIGYAFMNVSMANSQIMIQTFVM
jgi:hypothetical protein